ncbi:MAG: CBS domain-containing protein [Desulfurococcales archaeon]|nr:CBS domain-containing protein [Desulfurococcales archaeon]
MKIWEVMKEPSVKVLPRTPLLVARRIFRETEARVIPIIRDERSERLEGYITRVEAIIPTSTRSNLRVVDVARTHPVVRMSQDVEEALKTLEEHGLYAAPVVDDDDRLVGIVSFRDVIEALMGSGIKPKAETVNEVMTTEDLDKYIVDMDERINKVWSRFVYRGIPAIVVVRGERRPVGIITPYDLIRSGRWRFHREIKAGRIVTPARVKRIMTRGVVVATPDTRIEDVARVMVENDFTLLPVVDEEGRVIGVVTQADVARAYIEGAKPERRPVKPIPAPVPVSREEMVEYRGTQAMLQEVLVKPAKPAYIELGVKAGEIARPEMPAITINDTVEHARKEMLRRRVNYLLVVDEAGRIIGVVSKWSMLRALGLKGPLWRRRVYDKLFIDLVMDKALPKVKASDPLENVALAMVSNNAEVAVVEDEDGNTVGFITKDDLVEAYARWQQGRVLVENIMYPGRLSIVHPHHSLAHVVNRMKTLGLDALVVAEGGRVMGVVSSNRLPFIAYEDALTSRKSRRLIWVRRLVKGSRKMGRYVKVAPLVAADVMARTTTTLSPGDDVFKAIEEMRRENVDGLPVVGEDGEILGVVTKNTILREMARHARITVEKPVEEAR